MKKKIIGVEIQTLELSPAVAHVWFTFSAAHVLSTATVRGRLIGPRCLYASTVEVAYPLHAPAGTPTQPPEGLMAAVTIPEPNLWDVQSPFLYSGPVELWEDGQKCDAVTLRWGGREARVGAEGLCWNGRLSPTRGLRIGLVGETELRSIQQKGYNTVLVPVAEETRPVWEAADRIGLMVLGEVSTDSGITLKLLQQLRPHSCSLGWLVRPLALGTERLNQLLTLLYACCVHDRQILGLTLEEAPGEWLDNRARFVVCRPSLLPQLTRVRVPRVVWDADESVADAYSDVIGFIAEEP